MKIKELIEELQKYDPELEVFTPGYEGGYRVVEIDGVYDFHWNYYEEWYYGPHEKANDGEGNIQGIVI